MSDSEWFWEAIVTVEGRQAHVEGVVANLREHYGADLEMIEHPHHVGPEFEWQARCRLRVPAPGPDPAYLEAAKE